MPHRGGSNKYPQSMFWIKNNKNMFTPVNPSYYIKLRFNAVYISRTCFHDVTSVREEEMNSFNESVRLASNCLQNVAK